MAIFKVRKSFTQVHEAYIEAEDWEEAEEKARYDDSIEWEDHTDYYCDPDFDIDEEDE